MDTHDQLEVGALIVGLLGGLAVFLYGMEKMTEALKLVAGTRMKGLLARMTTNRFKGVFAGAFITSIIQSSSVTTVLVVGFITAGLMSLSQSIGVIMGASIGTTVTAQIVAFKVTKYSLVLVAAGFLTTFVSKREKVVQYGQMTMGLGLVFFGMTMMKQATSPLTDYEPFVSAMRDMDSLPLAVLFSALFTGLVQSSSATTGVIIVLASQGFIDLRTGIGLVYGANIGTCVTAALASIGKPREAVRAAMVHVLFNVGGVLVWFGFTEYLAEIVRLISPADADLEGVARLSAETPRQIANAHTVFNVSNTFIFIAFTPQLARLVEWLVPDRKQDDPTERRRNSLNAILVRTPALALDVVRMEMARLGDAALAMTKAALGPVLSGSAEDLDELEAMDEEIDGQHAALITYLGRLSLEPLTEQQSQRLSDSISIVNDFEAIGDLIETNLVDAGRQRLRTGLVISESTQGVLAELHAKVQWAVKAASEAVAAEDSELAREVRREKKTINRLAEEAESHLAERLVADEPNRLAAFRLESEMVEALKRIYYFAKRAARVVRDSAPPPEPDVPEPDSKESVAAN